jgi:hypothetical protein
MAMAANKPGAGGDRWQSRMMANSRQDVLFKVFVKKVYRILWNVYILALGIDASFIRA